LQRFLAPIKKKIFLLIGRAILTAIDNSGNIQKIQVTALKDETISDVERAQEYGLETYPKTDSEAEVIILFLNGNREQGICVKIHDRANRPTGLNEGDVYLYNADGFQVKLDSTGITLNSGDATTWKPNTLVTDPFTGAPHSVGITKLKGS
jgi:phage baseplate assembly protein V